jgi:rubrerythrin
MSNQPLTASAIITASQDLEARSARFYEEMSERFATHQAIFAGFARDCEKSSVQVLRTYQETVTDALETGFSFDGLSLRNYEVDVSMPQGIGLSEALKRALALEGKAIAFYLDVAERSESLLATIPRAFRRVARTRRRRKDKLQAM